MAKNGQNMPQTLAKNGQNMAQTFRKWHKINQIRENGGERKIFPSANPVYIHFGALGCEQLLILVPWGVQIVNVNLKVTFDGKTT